MTIEESQKIGVVIASRGTMFSRTMESVFRNIKGFNFELYMAHGLTIPDCFNVPLEKALDDGCDWIWFVEEDMFIPDGTLKKMFNIQNPVVTVDYADRRTGVPLAFRDNLENIVFSGMGCMLIKREVFERMEKPYLRQVVFWKKTEDNGDIWLEPHPEIKTEMYGQQDIYLCWAIKRAGYYIAELPNANIGHQRLVTKAEDVKNGVDMVEIVYINETKNTRQN